MSNLTKAWRTFRIFFIFSGRGRGRGCPGRKAERGWGFLLKIPEGGVSRGGGGSVRGPGGCLREFSRGGGGNMFFRGRNVHQENYECIGLCWDGKHCDALNGLFARWWCTIIARPVQCKPLCLMALSSTGLQLRCAKTSVLKSDSRVAFANVNVPLSHR